MDSNSPNARTVSFTVDADSDGSRVDQFVAGRAGIEISRSRVQQLAARGLLTINGQGAGKSSRVVAGDVVTLVVIKSRKPSIDGEALPLSIKFEDDHLLVIDKPPDMVTHPAPGHPTGTLVNAVVHHLGRQPEGGEEFRPGIVHRLDKNTSGLILVAKSEAAFAGLQQMIADREVKRQYSALVCGHLAEEAGLIDLPIGRSTRNRKKMAVTNMNSREARTEYQLRDRFRSYDLLELTLQTGRTHQIRVHLAHLGHPVLGDPDYGGREKWHRGTFAPERPLAKKILATLPRQALHAVRLTFNHPLTGESLMIESSPPADFQTVLDILNHEGR